VAGFELPGGLKTRAWPETEAALVNVVAAARQLRSQLAQYTHPNDIRVSNTR